MLLEHSFLIHGLVVIGAQQGRVVVAGALFQEVEARLAILMSTGDDEERVSKHQVADGTDHILWGVADKRFVVSVCRGFFHDVETNFLQ